MKRPIAIYIALSLLASAGAGIIGSMAHHQSPGGYGVILRHSSREVKQLRLISTGEQNLINAKSFPKRHAVLKKEDGGVIRWEIKLGG